MNKTNFFDNQKNKKIKELKKNNYKEVYFSKYFNTENIQNLDFNYNQKENTIKKQLKKENQCHL